MRILVWHVHGSWLTSFLQGPHDYLLPVTPGRDADGLGRATSWDWPARATEVAPADLRDADVDCVVLQRPHELELTERWTGRRPGTDVPAVFVEHNTPTGDVPRTRHALADRDDIPVVHVSHFNALMWDCGTAPTVVVEHGIVDPGHLYSGEVTRAAVVVNDPVRRGRAVGTDLMAEIADAVPLDVFGMKVGGLADHLAMVTPGRVRSYEDLDQRTLHRELARRRVYVHTTRWTSLGLSLLEAMHLGVPVVALATTEVVEAVPPGAGVVSTRPAVVAAAARELLCDPGRAAEMGAAARDAALSRYGLGRFLAEWEGILDDCAGRRPR
jgi:glycosyltransferase involved in cell wall biosynthesis